MTFFAFGLNHETAPLRVREAFALTPDAVRALYGVYRDGRDAEVVIVSTCNRTEVYLYGTDADVSAMQELLARRAGAEWPADHAFLERDEPAVRHVLEVTSGIRSMVLGDAQILAQVKAAYRVAAEEDSVGTVVHRLMHTAFRASKRVVRETELTSGAASVSSAAVAAARRHFGPEGLVGRRALLVGAGEMGRLALEALSGHRLSRIAVTNRSPERAGRVADAFGAAVVPWHERHAAVADADVVVVATGAAQPVLWADAIPPHPPSAQPTLVIDIAMPRNVDGAVDGLDGYRVLDLDALNAAREQAVADRASALPHARGICDDLLSEFVAWVFHHQALQPAIQSVRETFESIRRQEVERHHHRFSRADRAELDRLTASMMQKLLAVPIVRLKSVDPDSVDFVQGVQLLQALFARPGCDEAPARPGQLPRPGETYTPCQLNQGPARCPFEYGAESGTDAGLAGAILRSLHGAAADGGEDEASDA